MGLPEVNVIKYDTVNSEYDLVHYEQPESIVRGVIVDLKTDNLVAVSHIIQPPEVMKGESLQDWIDTSGLYETSQKTFNRGYESTAMRVWKRNGRIETSTHKRIRPINSRWGKSATFHDMYTQLNGPTDALFTDEADSNRCYTFLMVHPDILVASQEPDVGSGYIVFIGWVDMNNPRSINQPFSIPGYEHIKVSADISIEEANKFIVDGFGHQDPYMLCGGGVVYPSNIKAPELAPGEFVMVTEWTGVPWESDILRIHQVQSYGYNYRSSMRNNDPNIWHRIFVLSHQEFMYSNYYPWVSSVKPADQTGIYTAPNERTDQVQIELASHSQRLHNIWNVFLMCVPPCLKPSVSHMFHEFHMTRHNLATWISDLAEMQTRDNDIRAYVMSEIRINQIIDFAHRRLDTTSNLTAQIQRILKSERGESLYRLANRRKEFFK